MRRVLSETGLEPQRLELEITEGIILQNTEAVLETLQRLDQLPQRIEYFRIGGIVLAAIGAGLWVKGLIV